MAEILTVQQQAEALAEQTQEKKNAQEIPHSAAIAEKSPERAEGKSEQLYQQIITQVQSKSTVTADDASTVDLDAKAIVAIEDMQVQVERLVQLAELKGVVYAVQVARKLDFYVLDQVHDQLANHLYDTLITKGLIEKE
ncbi:MAG: hypothetical protein WCG84_01700 [Candidatus Moraniibacteriota bacterium]